MQAVLENIKKNTFCAQIRAQFHTSIFMFFVKGGISLNRSAKYESIMSTEHNNVELTCFQRALIMPLFIQNSLSETSAILLISDDVIK